MSTNVQPALRLVGLTALLLTASLLAVGLHAVRLDRVGGPELTFLFWNLFLAWIPYIIALAMTGLDRVHSPGWALGILGVGWLLFLPNAPYILTDFIYIGAFPGAPPWFDALLIGAFACAGLLLGHASLLLVHELAARRLGSLAGWGLAIGSLILSSLGVYLGRFARFNSWDTVTNPDELIQIVLRRLIDPLGNPFLLIFAAAMTLGLVGSYLITWLVDRAVSQTPLWKVAP